MTGLPSDTPSTLTLAVMQYSSLKILTDSQSTELDSAASYDLAIIGAGVSSAWTLIHYISLLEQRSSICPTPVKIVVTEKSGEFWTGIPYGSRSGNNSLLISSLQEFIPQPLERSQFVTWLNQNRSSVFAPAKYADGALASTWLQANQSDLEQGLWDDLFIPRHVFGLYIHQYVTTVVATATAKGLIEVELMTAEAIDIQRIDGSYQVDVAATTGDLSSFLAHKLVLAIGSPPNVAFEHPQSSGAEPEICYIDNMYEPSLDFNIQRICQSIKESHRPSHRQMLIVGSNAGTLDTLYGLNNSTELTSLIDKFIILSPNAAFPHRINRVVPHIDYTPAHLIALAANVPFTAKQIFQAVELDVADATARHLNISDIYLEFSKAVMTALNLLNPEEQKQFVIKYAVEIGKLQRRAGGEYLDVVDRLIAQGKLEFIKGKFSKYQTPTDDGSGCEYINATGELKSIDAPIGVIINCAGFQDVTKSSSVLIKNLIQREICCPNDSKRGFLMDKNYEASKNCYLMGPLVAGNIDGDFKIWHAESCQRILSLSKQLAEVLLRPQQQELPTVIVSAATAEVDNASILVNA